MTTQQQAEQLYFQTDLPKTEIAEHLGISRRTLHYWIKDNEWERLKKSAEHMPGLLAENCYLIMAKIQRDILSEARQFTAVTPEEINMMNKLSATIKKLTGRNTLNETLELKGHFMDFLNAQSPDLADAVKPLVNAYIKSRAAIQPHQFMGSKVNEFGALPIQEKNTKEAQLDLEDMIYWADNPPTPETYKQPETNTNNQPAPIPETPPTRKQTNVASSAPANATIPLHQFSNTQHLNRARRRELARNLSKKKQAA